MSRLGATPYTALPSPLPSGLSDEADLSAEEAQASPDPRFPGPERDPVRPSDPEAPASEGPQAAHPVDVGALRAAPMPAGAASPGAATSTASTARATRAATASWSSTPLRGEEDDRRRRAPRALRGPQDRQGRDPEQGEAGGAGGVLGALRRPRGRARLRDRRPPGRRGAARARGRRTACAPRWRSCWTARARSVCRETVADRPAGRADPRLPALHLAGLRAPLPLLPDLLGVRRRRRSASSGPSEARSSPAGGCCAATRSATAASTSSPTGASSATPRPAPSETAVNGRCRKHRAPIDRPADPTAPI